MKYLLKNINVLNIILLTIVIFEINYIALPFLKMDIKYAPSKIKKISKKGDKMPEKYVPSFTEYMIISEQNPFHPERIIPVEKNVEQKAPLPPPLPKPEIILYGTVISDDISLAYIKDKKSPLTTPGRGERVRVIKKGQEINGFILKEIQSDKIVLEKEKEIMTISLTSPSKKREILPSTAPTK